ncbi:recombinase family protein [Porphyrobacter sp. AAP82]|uniref:recombinase family protein n=1 Tax=Porphyrobacter sp. AAP82 TaxID=1248917 RepID=UPI000375167C|nr:recombinase family protein [Porphyrobacter sp. AAP82]
MFQSAILYARFSTTEQAKGYSLERQLSEGRRYIEQKGWLLEKEISDQGKSAYHGYNRLEGAELHTFEEEAKAGLHKGKVLVVENLDRLSRQGAKAAAQFIWSLNEYGVSVATTHDNQIYKAESTGNDMMELFSIIIKAQLSYEESFKKSERSKSSWASRHAKIRDGSKATTAIKAPAWIDKKDGVYVLNEHRVKVLNEIYDLYLDGIGIYKIVQILNDRKEPVWAVRERDGKGGWYLPYVHRLLKKRAVLGEYVALTGETLATDYYPQAISAEKFNRVQAMINSKGRTGGHAYKRMSNLLSGIVICGVCEGTAGYENKGTNNINYTKKSGERVVYKRRHYERLRCDNARRKHTCSNNTLYDYKTVEACVLDNLGRLLIEEKEAETRVSIHRERIAELSRQIEVKASQLENLIDALAGGSKAVAARIVALEEEIDTLKTALEDAEINADAEESEPTRNRHLEIVEALRMEINDPDPDKRFFARSKVNSSLKRIVDRIYLSQDGSFLVFGYDKDVWLMFERDGTDRWKKHRQKAIDRVAPVDRSSDELDPA